MSRIQPLRIKGMELGDGIVKICVPVVAENEESFEKAVAALHEDAASYDLIEWRADIEIGAGAQMDEARIGARVKAIRAASGDKPVLFTIRTAREGGNADLTFERYAQLCMEAARAADLVDIELFTGTEQQVKTLAEQIHKAGKHVVMSSHDFDKTPSDEEMTGRLVKMQALGADVSKLAVMPQSEEDVLRLLGATVKMKNELADRPFITMSMGSLGRISRMSGALTGSALTFATLGRASAPGQVDAKTLRTILSVLG